MDFSAPTVGSATLSPDLNWFAALKLAIGAASVQSAAIQARCVMVSPDQNCWITIGVNPTATIGAGSLFLPAGAMLTLPIQPGQKIAVIQTATPGNLSIVPGNYLPDSGFPAPTITYDFTSGTLDPSITFTRATTATYFNATGTLQTAASGIARFDYDPTTLQAKGLLIEEVRTNNLLSCRDLTNAAWVATNCTTALDQTGITAVANSASSITATAANATILQSITLASAARFQTAYVKRITGTGPVNMTMDGGTTWTAIAVTASWARVSIPTQTLANPVVGFQLTTSGDKIAVDYAQNENGTSATSSIATSTVAVTRNADVAYLPNPLANPSEGTLFYDTEMTAINNGNNNVFGGISDTTFANAKYWVFAGTTLSWVMGGAGPSTPAPNIGTRLKLAGTYKLNVPNLAAVNSMIIQGSTQSAIPAGTRISFGCDPWQGVPAHQINGHVRAFAYYPFALSSPALQQITT